MEVTGGFTDEYQTVAPTSYPTGTVTRGSTSPSCALHRFIVMCVVGALLVTLGLAGNVLVITILGRERAKSATIFLLYSLAIADSFVLLTYGIMSIPSGVTLFMEYKDTTRNLNAISYVYVGCVAKVTNMIKTWLTVTVTWQRYVNVCLPFKAKVWGTLSIAKRQLISIVLFSVLFNIRTFLLKRLILDYPKPGLIAFALNDLAKTRLYQIIYGTCLYYLLYYILPIIGLTYMTFVLIASLRKAYKKRQTMMTSHVTSESEDKRREITLTLIIVVVMHAIFCLPSDAYLQYFTPIPLTSCVEI